MQDNETKAREELERKYDIGIAMLQDEIAEEKAEVLDD